MQTGNQTEENDVSQDQPSSKMEEALDAGPAAFCFVTRQSSFKTIRANTRADAQAKGNRNVAYGPVNWCHNGACIKEDQGYPDPDEGCIETEGLTAFGAGAMALPGGDIGGQLGEG
jgi:hypothetical protein